MKNVVMTATLAALALSTGACSMQQQSAQQLNTTNANSRI